MILAVELPMVVKTVSNNNVSVENVNFIPGSDEMLSSRQEGAINIRRIPMKAGIRVL